MQDVRGGLNGEGRGEQRGVKMGKGSQIYEIGYHRRAGRGGGFVGV